jgi:hypothetical protein
MRGKVYLEVTQIRQIAENLYFNSRSALSLYTLRKTSSGR